MDGYGLWSIAPPIIAILLAIVARRVIPALFLGVVFAAIILSWRPLQAGGIVEFVPSVLTHLFESFLWPSLANADHLRVLCFTMLMGAMVGVIHCSGGMIGIAHLFAPLAKSRVGGQLSTYVMGLVIFFDDYANTLLVGNTMRPITDRLGISREKLAYIVDTTAAPIAGLSLISTWVATEISYVDSGTSQLITKYGQDAFTGSYEGFWVIAQTIPYRFYILFALVFVIFVILLRRDFGSMLQAEQRASDGVRDPAHPPSSLDATDDTELLPKWYNAAIPVLVMVFMVIGLIISTGWHKISAAGETPTIWSAFPKGDSYVALVYGSFSGWAVAALLCRLQGLQKWDAIRSASLAGARSVVPALLILWMAWSLSLATDTQYLRTGEFLSGLINPVEKPDWISDGLFQQYRTIVSPNTMPTLVFVISCFIAFSTGTSWGTMAIVTPLVVVVVYEMLATGGEPVSMSNPLMLASVGSVLAGSIFGDHCSPISDTTVLSSQSSCCNHIAHVRTQMLYALVVAVVSMGCGTIPVGFGLPVTVALPLGIIAMFIILMLLGRQVSVTAEPERPRAAE